MGIAIWRVTIKPTNVSFWGHAGFRPEKNVCLPTQLGACSHPTGRSTVPYWCTIDVRTPWARHGVTTGPPGPCRAPTAARQPSRGSKGDLRRTPLLRSSLDPLEGRRAAVGARRGPGGPVGTLWRAQGVRTSIVHQYGTVERPVG